MKQIYHSVRPVKTSGPINFIGFSFELAAACIVLSISILISCGKETMEIPTPSFNYFPTEKGKWIVYSVDSIVHSTDDNNNDDSVYYFHYQVKEVIDSSITDGEGNMRQVLVRYFRNDTTEAWNINSVWTQALKSNSAYRWEENIPYHKLSFPINSDVEWNMNDQNTLDP